VEYETQSYTPILSIEDAVAKNSFFTIPSFLPSRESIGDVDKNFSEADHVVRGMEVSIYHSV
jgi:hypothetical protein